MVLTGDAFLQHLHDCKMLPGHSLKSKKSAFSVFLWKRKGWVTLTSLVTLVMLRVQPHMQKKCVAIFSFLVNKVCQKLKLQVDTNQAVWLWLRFVVPWSSKYFQRNHCTAALLVSSAYSSAKAATDCKPSSYHVTVKTPNPKREAAFCGVKKGLRVSRRINTSTLEGFRRFNMMFSRDLQGLFHH